MAERSQVQGARIGNGVRPALAAAILAALASAPGTAWTQTAPAAEAGGLQEIVVTATRHEENLSRVPISVTALTQESLDVRGVKDFQDIAKFTPGVNVDNSGTNNISIRGISSTGGAGTTGIYIDDTPIQMRALAFNPDETLPKSFDIERIEVLRGPQGTLFGAGSEGGTVRYITAQPSLTKTSVYSRSEVSYTAHGDPSYEAGVAGGTPLIDGTLGVRASVWYRKDGGWIDRIDPDTLATVDRKANHDETFLLRLAAVWAVNDKWSMTPSIYYQDRQRNDIGNYWPLYSDPSSGRFVNANPTPRPAPDTFYLPALKIEGDLGFAKLISNTSYYHRKNTTGYDGTLYNLGFYQTLFQASAATNNLNFPLLVDGSGLHLAANGVAGYRSPASVANGQQNFTQEVRLQSNGANAQLFWTTGIFYASNRQSYVEQIGDPNLNGFLQSLYPLMGLGAPTNGQSNPYVVDYFGVGYDPSYPSDSYFLKTNAKDEQLAWFGEATYSFTEQLKGTVGLRLSKMKYSFTTLTGGPQLFGPTVAGAGDQSENAFTPKISLAYQIDPKNMVYGTYAKGFRPGGANNPVPQAACAADFQSFGITSAPQTYNSDSVNSFEVGMKNNIHNQVRIASSVYYIQWQNIQQTVIPPICQISWIQNLGEAHVKGADIQAEIAVTDAFTTEIAAGYTDARYSKSSLVTPTSTVAPVALNGDAIVGQSGQPGAPFTATLGLEYKFSIAERESFLRLDYEYQGKAKWLGPTQDPNSLQYDSANYTVDATNFVTLRGGVKFGGWQISPFIDNLTNTHPVTNYNWTIDPGNGGSRLERDFTFRPRTYGITFTYRN